MWDMSRERLAPFRRLMVWLVVFMTISVMVMYSLIEDHINDSFSEICKIPELDPWDVSVKKYLQFKSEILQCPKAYNIMFVDDSGFIVYNESAIGYYHLRSSSLRCTYQTVIRIPGDKEVIFGPRKQLQPPMFVNSTVFRVSCFDKKTLVYDYLHLNPFWVENQRRESEIGVEDDDHYSVLLIGIDSVSRSHALRSLPKSYKYLMETLGAYDFKGFMKVGSNTFPNIIPLLTGKRHGDFPLINNRISYCDSMPLLWNEDLLKQYASLYSDDRSDISTFNFLKSGFYDTPTDFYYRTYNMAMNLFEPVIMQAVGTKDKTCPWECPCYANKDNFTLQVDHFKGFLRRYEGKRKFSFFWSNAAHESFDLVRHSDNTLKELLRWMNANGHMEKAVVMILSDHGLRLGDFSATHIGRLEGHFPFLSLVVPERLKMKYPSIKRNLLLNSDRIITFFDIHRSVIDIASNKFENTAHPVGKTLIPRNIFSLIPKTRTCADAGVPPNFCMCLRGDKTLSTNDVLVHSLAAYAVNKLNTVLVTVANICSKLTLLNVIEARVQYTCSDALYGDNRRNILGFLEPLLKNSFGFDWEDCGKSGKYKLLFHALPSKGLFEAMVEYNDGIGNGNTSHMNLIGDVGRIDRYGNQSHCIKENALFRQYCYCKDLV